MLMDGCTSKLAVIPCSWLLVLNLIVENGGGYDLVNKTCQAGSLTKPIIVGKETLSQDDVHSLHWITW